VLQCFVVANYIVVFDFGVRHAFSSSLVFAVSLLNVRVYSRCFCGSLLFCYTMLTKQLELFKDFVFVL